MTSLRSRLGVGLLLSLVVMLGLLWLTAGMSLRGLMEEQVVSRLEHDAEPLLGGIRFDAAGMPFIQSGRLQGIYRQPFSGHYFQLDIEGQVIRSRSLWDQILEMPEVGTGETRITYTTGPLDQPLLQWTRGFRKQGMEIRIAVAEDMVHMTAGIRRFQWRLLAWSLAVVFLLLLIQQYIVLRSVRPVSAAADEITRLEHGEIMTLHEQVPAEVRPLVQAINKLLQRQQQRLIRSREALGNLAHAIKTPLTVLQQLAAEKIPDSDADTHRQLQHYGRQVRELVDKSLRQARLAGDSLGTARFDLDKDLPGLIETLNRLHQGRHIDFRTRTGGTVQLPLEQQDGMELLGNLLDNAWKWADSRVLLAVTPGQPLTISVEDDGPGIGETGLDELAQRGIRQDENTPGHGIGLSVVKGLVEDLGGTIGFGASPQLGGLQVLIRLP